MTIDIKELEKHIATLIAINYEEGIDLLTALTKLLQNCYNPKFSPQQLMNVLHHCLVQIEHLNSLLTDNKTDLHKGVEADLHKSVDALEILIRKEIQTITNQSSAPTSTIVQEQTVRTTAQSKMDDLKMDDLMDEFGVEPFGFIKMPGEKTAELQHIGLPYVPASIKLSDIKRIEMDKDTGRSRFFLHTQKEIEDIKKKLEGQPDGRYSRKSHQLGSYDILIHDGHYYGLYKGKTREGHPGMGGMAS